MDYKKLNDKATEKAIAQLEPSLIHMTASDKSYATGDIESYQGDNLEWHFKLGVVLYEGVFHSFHDVRGMFDFINSLPCPCYFHNLDFDLLFFLREDSIMELCQNQPLIQSGNMTLTVTIDNAEFKNSLSLFPMSLLNVVKKYLKINDPEYINNKANVLDLTDEQNIVYCSKDCLYLHLAIQKYTLFVVKLGKSNGLGLTTPSTAYSMLMSKFIAKEDKETLFSLKHRKSHFFKENYYYGGHTEKFVNGRKVFRNCHYYDVNSLYPFIMRNIVFSTGYPVIVAGSNKKKLKSILSRQANLGKCFYAEITLNVDSEELRFFPTYDDKKKCNRYLFGDIRIKISEVGYNFIMKYGSKKNIKEVHKVLYYRDSETTKPFTNFVDTFYALRKSDPSNDLVCKLFLNSTYGKFGEKLERLCRYLNTPNAEINGEFVSYKPFGSENQHGITTIMEQAPWYKKQQNRLDIAGKITESARLYMGELINDVRALGEKVYYTDTDSIITSCHIEDTILKNHINDKELGKLTNEIGYADSVIILGTKMYHFYKSEKKATKGIKNMTLNDFKEVVRGKNKFLNERFTKMSTLIDRGFFGLQYVPYEIKHILERLD